MKRHLLSLALLALLSHLSAQLSESIEKEIDENFSELNEANTPGVAAAIIKDGELVYLKGFGKANMEEGDPITPQTKFQLGELSKQFTTLAILLLEEQGKINRGDDIRKYIPKLPSYDHTITIDHLLNHSSGLYDIRQLNRLLKGSSNSILTQEEAITLIANQKKLYFEPGTDFSFHEAITESILMAEIVAAASDMPFAEFVKNNIFEPLGMTNSLIRDDSKMIIDNVAEPYLQNEETLMKNEVRSSVVGAINAYCSAEDLAKWYLNFTTPKGKLGSLIQKLDTPVMLEIGKKFVYYWGEMSIGREFTHPERGLPIYWNFGIQGGYGSNIFRYLDQKIISVVLGNNGQYNGAFAMHAIDPFVKDLYLLPDVIDVDALDIKKLSTKRLKAHEGYYWFKKAGYATQMSVEKDTLRSRWLFADQSRPLLPLSDNIFQMIGRSEDVRLFNFKKENNEYVFHFTFNESEPDIMKRYIPVESSDQYLQSYEGVYYNEEYATLFTFKVENNQLVAENLEHGTIEFMSITKDVFTSRSTFMNAIEFRRESNGVGSFSIDADGIHDLVFTKVPSPKR